MSEFVIRAAAEGEQRALFELLGQALHAPPVTDAQWARRQHTFLADRAFGAFAGADPVGVVSSFAAELAVPGGKQLPTAMLDGMAVRPDHTRRGLMTAMIGEQTRDCVRRGDVLAALHASQTTIYGRFGYGIATRGKTLRVSTARARFRQDAPTGGRVRLLDERAAIEQIPALYQRIAPYRPGMVTRPGPWWPGNFDSFVAKSAGHVVAVHTGDDGDDGFVVYRTTSQRSLTEPGRAALLEVRELHAANVSALAGLWRYLLAVDLVETVHATMRPMDESIDVMLTDSRACDVIAVADRVWLRLLDVPTALAARSYGQANPVVIEVTDRLVPENSGRYRVHPGGAESTEDTAHLRMDVDTLAMLYLGEWAPSTLVAAGRIDALDPAAVASADDLFRAAVLPWCGTHF